MEQVIEVMRTAVPERRSDGKASPLVGALLWKPDGSTQTAARGELRDGDHAEFTLLERKNHDRKLDGCILFATLEPCAPGSRKPPKVSCAERIVSARIKDVWVGIEDPDPTVDRQGIQHLQDRGVTVHLFDADLQKIVRAENAGFISQALERAKFARREGPAKAATLSSFEDVVESADMTDLRKSVLLSYAKKLGLGAPSARGPLLRSLALQGLIVKTQTGYKPTGFAILLFGDQPRDVFPQAGLIATIRYPDGSEENRSFDGPLLEIPGYVEDWLKRRLPSTIDRRGMERRERPALPFEMLREAIINALVHRDYDVAGAKCQVLVTPSEVVLRSPGRPPVPVTLEQMQTFNAPTLSRNPRLHYVFRRMGLAEEAGFGMTTLRNAPAAHGLPKPRYSFQNPYLVLTIYRDSEAALGGLKPGVLKSLSRGERSGWKWLATRQTTASGEYARALHVPNRTALNHIKRFTQLRLLRKVGSGPATRYEVIDR